MQPRIESRITTLESRVSVLEASLQELSADQAAELRIIKQAVQRVHDTMMASFDEIGTLFDQNWARLSGIEARLDRIEATLPTLATKDDLAAMETRIIATVTQLLQQKNDS
jgi:uncharacterized coiled-coil protein SlyX